LRINNNFGGQMVGLSIGGKTPKTSLSMKEIVDKTPYVMMELGKLVERHDTLTDPLQRAEIESQIAAKFFSLHNFLGKFGTAFLSRIGRNLSNTEIRALFAAYPNNPLDALENYKEKSKQTLDQFRDEAGDEMHKFYGLRRLSVEIKKGVSSDVSARLAWIRKRMQQLGSKTVENAKRVARQKKGKSIWDRLFPKKPALQPVRI
jgi:hypothetical protein